MNNAASPAALWDHWRTYNRDIIRTQSDFFPRLADLASRILGHSIPHGQATITAVYDRFDRLPETAAALNAWARTVSFLVSSPRPRTFTG